MSDGEVYTYSGTCRECGHETNAPITKRVAAFFDDLGPAFLCENCGSDAWKTAAHSMPDVDVDLLGQWMADASLHFMMQDEELIISSADVVDLTAAFKTAEHSYRKEQVAISLAIKFFDQNFNNDSEKSACQGWLMKNQATWREYRDYDYVSKEVAERLGIQ